MRVACSWSGGKDSCLAYYKAIQEGHEVVSLLNLVSREYGRCCFHGIPIDLIEMQAEAIGIPILLKDVPQDMDKYEEEFKNAVIELKDKYDIEGIVFGDIYLDEHKDWVERVCSEAAGVLAIESLWNKDTLDLINEFMDLGFKTAIVSAKESLFDSSIVGKTIDSNIVKDLLEKNICVCGEGGEFHTFVYDGPLFNKKIAITESETALKDGFWKHWFLDIKSFQMEEKI